MFLVKWEDEPRPDKLEWLAAVRQALVEEPGSYRVRFHRGPRGWRFDLECRSEAGSLEPVVTRADDGVTLNVFALLADAGKPLDPDWDPLGVPPRDTSGRQARPAGLTPAAVGRATPLDVAPASPPPGSPGAETRTPPPSSPDGSGWDAPRPRRRRRRRSRSAGAPHRSRPTPPDGFSCRTRALTDAAAQARVWSLREAALGLSMATRGDGKAVSFVEDTAVAPERLRDYIARFLHIVERYDTHAGVYAHASVGCLHVRPVVNMKTAAGLAAFEGIATEVADLVLEFGGALSGEHGDGLVRGAFNERMFGPTLYQAFRTVKRTFDPNGLFNPGRIVETPPITAHLRFGAGYETPDPPTHFDYAAFGGFGRAVEMCSGVGACRKTREGTMCPSYMATKDEAHSTRGRANVLRLALNGRMDEAGLDAEP